MRLAKKGDEFFLEHEGEAVLILQLDYQHALQERLNPDEIREYFAEVVVKRLLGTSREAEAATLSTWLSDPTINWGGIIYPRD